MSQPRDLDNYVEYRLAPGLWAVVWKKEVHSYHPTRKRANLTLWQLRKVHKVTKAEPRPLSRLDRIIQDNWLDPPASTCPKEPVRSLTGLPCPDCDGTLYLRQGRFGLFYGCENYSKTLCRGSVSSNAHGVPFGIPANAATRRARYLLRTLLNRRFVNEGIAPFPVKDYSLEQCRTAIAELCEDNPEMIEVLHRAPDPLHRTRLERLISEQDPLDKMLGPIGVDPTDP